MGVKKELEKLHEEIRKCRKCGLWKTRMHAVPGEGPADARIIFLGEAPGRVEDETGRPFKGRAGKLLTELIEDAGLKRGNVFITSPIKCRPPKNRKPKQKEIDACMPYLNRQIELINPKTIVLLGNTAIRTMLGNAGGVNKIHGKNFSRDGKNYFTTFHPAAGIRGTRTKMKLFEDFKRLRKLS